ncbi:MAG: hypothetical protein JSV61_08755 [Anaerolineales bacterium]|nr:MAG: hypothetical protein JSV61_08755 [Anaerolineales bacterium]
MKKMYSNTYSIPRPWSVTLLAVVVLSMAILNLVRGWQAIAQREFLFEILAVPWLYLASSGMVWGLIGLVLFLGLWQGYTRVPMYTALAAFLYSVYYWVDRMLVTTDRAQANLPFALIFNLMIILLIFRILSLRKTRTFFGEWHDR